jgi:uncharacterized protein YcbK (DUF882 family)
MMQTMMVRFLCGLVRAGGLRAPRSARLPVAAGWQPAGKGSEPRDAARPMRFSAVAALVLALSVPLANAKQTLRPPTAALPRFFLAGSGRLVLHHGHFGTTLDVRYRRADGTYDADALAQIGHFFRSREDGRETAVDLRLIELLAYIHDHYHPRQMILTSGFRSPEFNADLRNAGGGVARASLHTEAMAADIMFTGLDMRRLWQQLRVLHSGGAGYYRSGKFIHIDTGPARFWEETTSRVGEDLSAGNARIFTRTDFDRYPRVDGAAVRLHSVTAFPLLIAAEAAVVDSAGSMAVTLQPTSNAIALQDGCFAVAAPAQTYEFRVARTAADASSATRTQAHLVLHTCEPRIGKTPAEIESNEIEIAH